MKLKVKKDTRNKGVYDYYISYFGIFWKYQSFVSADDIDEAITLACKRVTPETKIVTCK